MYFAPMQEEIVAWVISKPTLAGMEDAMDKYIKSLIGINLLIFVASRISGDYDAFILMLVVQLGIIVVIILAKIFLHGFGLDDGLTIEPIDDDFQPDPQFSDSFQDMGGFTIQPIIPSPGAAMKVDSGGMKIINPQDLIPDEVYCSICGKNISLTRYDFGGVLVCPHSDCGQWYHKNHFYDTAKGKCISPKCRERQ
jgi:hypothetical protein